MPLVSTANAWVIVLEAIIAFTLVLLISAAKDLLRTLKRLEARMTLTNPLEEERKILEGNDVVTGSAIRNRALHPDIWWEQHYAEIKDLKGKQLKQKIKLWRYRERRYRS